MDLKELQRRAALCSTDVNDVAFRYTIFASQSGDLARYIYHDPLLNPKDRLHGSPADEESSYGHAFVWLASLANARGVNIEAAIDIALKAIESREYMRRHNDSNEVKGETAHAGVVEGTVFKLETPVNAAQLPKETILVVRHGGPELVGLFDNVVGIVADEGGVYSHLAILSRERGIPCVVGTGNATRLLSTGQRVRLDATGKTGTAEPLKNPE